MFKYFDNLESVSGWPEVQPVSKETHTLCVQLHDTLLSIANIDLELEMTLQEYIQEIAQLDVADDPMLRAYTAEEPYLHDMFIIELCTEDSQGGPAEYLSKHCAYPVSSKDAETLLANLNGVCIHAAYLEALKEFSTIRVLHCMDTSRAFAFIFITPLSDEQLHTLFRGVLFSAQHQLNSLQGLN